MFYLPVSLTVCEVVNDFVIGEFCEVIDWWDDVIINVSNTCVVVIKGLRSSDVVYSTSSDVIASLVAVWVVVGYWEVVDRVEGWEVIVFCVVAYSLVVMTSDADVMICWLDVSSSLVVDWTADDVGVWDIVDSRVVCIDVPSVIIAVVDTTVIEKILVR